MRLLAPASARLERTLFNASWIDARSVTEVNSGISDLHIYFRRARPDAAPASRLSRGKFRPKLCAACYKKGGSVT